MFEDKVVHYHNFPKPGIDFIDIMPVLQNKQLYKTVVNQLASMVTAPNIATMEARGFLFAPSILSVSDIVQVFVPIRKKGKLPFKEGDMRHVVIHKEYGDDIANYRLSDLAACIKNDDVIEITLFDDLLATGGTVKGIIDSLLQERIVIDDKAYRIRLKECVFLAELTNLPGRSVVEQYAPVKSLMQVTEEI